MIQHSSFEKSNFYALDNFYNCVQRAVVCVGEAKFTLLFITFMPYSVGLNVSNLSAAHL